MKHVFPPAPREQAGALAARTKRIAAAVPAWSALEAKLLALDGLIVVPPLQPSLLDLDILDALILHGRAFDLAGLQMRPGARSGCHENAVRLHRADPTRVSIATGYGLSPDGLWREHSWALAPSPSGPTILETTEIRLVYFGVPVGIADE